jgi:hypothetical protein
MSDEEFGVWASQLLIRHLSFVIRISSVVIYRNASTGEMTNTRRWHDFSPSPRAKLRGPCRRWEMPETDLLNLPKKPTRFRLRSS